MVTEEEYNSIRPGDILCLDKGYIYEKEVKVLGVNFPLIEGVWISNGGFWRCYDYGSLCVERWTLLRRQPTIIIKL